MEAGGGVFCGEYKPPRGRKMYACIQILRRDKIGMNTNRNPAILKCQIDRGHIYDE